MTFPVISGPQVHGGLVLLSYICTFYLGSEAPPFQDHGYVCKPHQRSQLCLYNLKIGSELIYWYYTIIYIYLATKETSRI